MLSLRLTLAFATTLLVVLCALEAEAQQVPVQVTPEPVVVRLADYQANTTVLPTHVMLGKRAGPKTAEIVVDYVNFPESARAAFQFAVDQWERHISSSVPIRIQATWEPLEPAGVLGSARPWTLSARFPGAARDDVWYPIGLAEAVSGQPQNASTDPDIVASFNSNFEAWYFGADENVPTNQLSFATVVMHEIGHGLGFFGSFIVDDGVGDQECPEGGTGTGCWGVSSRQGDLFPVIFDLFAEDAQEISLLNTEVYPNPSSVLASALTSDALFYSAPLLRRINDDLPADLYAPFNFEPGSSFSHLDERTFPPGSPNSLMTPQIARNEAIFSPGAFTCAILSSIGWPLGSSCMALVSTEPILASLGADVQEGRVRLIWSVRPGASVERLQVLRSYEEGPFLPVDTLDVDPGASYEFSYDPPFPGRYVFRLDELVGEETVMLGETAQLFVPPTEPITAAVYPNPFAGRATLTLFSSEERAARVIAYDALGQRLGVLFEGTLGREEARRVPLEGTRFSAGVYYLRIVTALGSETISVVHVE